MQKWKWTYHKRESVSSAAFFHAAHFTYSFYTWQKLKGSKGMDKDNSISESLLYKIP